MAKIAVELAQAVARRRARGASGCTTPRPIAAGDGWSVSDVVCTCGPHDRSFEERHTSHTIAIVLAGTFQYRTSSGGGLMTPGSVMLGNPRQYFECGHEHGDGDRCVSFWYAPEYFERLAADAGARGSRTEFGVGRLPPLRDLSPLVARAALGLTDAVGAPWEELSADLAARVSALASGTSGDWSPALPNAQSRVTRAVRMIDRHPEASSTLAEMAGQAGLSSFHFLRTFERVTGVTPHQYVLRARLRQAAMRLVAESRTVLDIALDCGFGDCSSFNRAFRTEFGVSPREYRKRH